MKNIALACLNYESATKHLPPGFIATGPVDATESWAWSTFTLPYLEEQAVFDQMRPSETFLQPVDGTRTGKRNLADVFKAAGGSLSSPELKPLQAIIPIFRCPSDSLPPLCPIHDQEKSLSYDAGTFERSFDGANSPAGFQAPVSNYMGVKGMVDASCSGSGASPNWLPNADRCANNGVFFGNSNIRLKQITDGLSQTFMIGERDKYCRAGTWIGVRNPLGGNDMHSSIWALGHVGDPYGKLNYFQTGASNTCTEGFSSSHPGGGFFAFCDGSVHWINDDIQFDVLPALNKTNPTDCFAIKGSGSSICKSQDPANPANMIGVYQRLAWRDDALAIGGTDY